MTLPTRIEDTAQLEDLLSAPTPGLVESVRRLEGDVVILGAGGKMGPTLARMMRRAQEAAGVRGGVTAVSRFSQPDAAKALEQAGVNTVACDLLDEDAWAQLPDAPHVVFMTGMKFGATEDPPLTWAMNAHLPGLVRRRYPHSRVMAFSTGNVYGLVPVTGGGSLETDPPRPDGEYAASCVGRERLFEYFSRKHNAPLALVRLNYACELRYGILVDLAQKVLHEAPIPLATGCFNIIWQGDANAMSLQALECAAAPGEVINVTGPEILSVRQVCEAFGERFNKTPRFEGTEGPDALLNNAGKAFNRFGYPTVDVTRLMDWIADWLLRGGETLDKPTHFEVRDGKF